MTQPDPDLVWFFCDSASELGMRAQSISDTSLCVSNVPTQHWPTARMCKAAARQRDIREALHELSDRLQSILECAYQPQGITVQDRHAHDLAAPLIARVLLRMKDASHADQKKLKAIIVNAPMLLASAHAAFRIAYGTPPARSRRSAARSRAERWIAEDSAHG